MQTLGIFKESFCSQCKGACCKGYPGTTWPEDWGAPNEKQMRARIAEALATGRWTIESWEADPRAEDKRKNPAEVKRTYIVRPAMAGFEGATFNSERTGRCTFLDESVGCTLTKEERPTQCRMLIPAENFPTGCDYQGPYQRADCATAWFPYQHILTYYLLHY